MTVRDGEQTLLGRTIDVSSTQRVVFPDIGVTKGDVVDYHRRIAEHALPYLEGRPLALKRFPEGIDGQGFFQKRAAEHFPDWIARVDVPKREGGILPHVVVGEQAVLAYLANQGVIELHPWLATADDLEHPDQLVFDLDPPRDDIEAAREATRLVGGVLDELGMPHLLKTSGSKGYHVHVRLDRSADADEARRFGADVAALLTRRHPDRLTDESRKAARRGRVLVDFLRNGYGQTVVAPYSLRARPGAPVATPISWNELGSTEPRRITIANVFRRLGQQREEPWAKGWHRQVSLHEARARLDDALADAA